VACSFCLKGAPEVAKIIEGSGAYICDGCVGLCVEILQAPRASDGGAQLPTWREMDDDRLLARLPRTAAVAAQVEGSLHLGVGEARRRGLAWARIGDVLEMTRQSAWERFSSA
jgi:ATP-dependent Clp protease ATP-binding subunit ClpX